MNHLKSRIACGKNKVFGVTEEGKILVTGVAEGAVTPISHWEDIAAISVGGQVVGLKKDGTVIVSGDNRDGRATPKIGRILLLWLPVPGTLLV